MSAPLSIGRPALAAGAGAGHVAAGGSDSLSSSPGDPTSPCIVHSTSPPCIPRLPPSPRSVAPPSHSILLNPVPTKSRSRSPPRLHNPFRRASLDQQLASAPAPPPTASTSAHPLQRRRAPSVTVEVYQSPPPAHFFNQAAQDASDEGSVPSTPDFSGSPPRGEPYPHVMRSRSVSPAAGHSFHEHPPPPRSEMSTDLFPSSPASQSLQLAASPGASSTLTLDSTVSSSNGSSAGTSVTFAPLPPGRRAHRSNSLSIGVASRAQMIQSQGGTPNVRSAKYAGPLAWHEGGPLPEDVYSWKDVQRGMSKLLKRVRGSSSAASTGSAASAASEHGEEATSDAGDLSGEGAAFRGRSLSISSVTSSSGSADEARRMEREAKGKSREIEHIEEAEEEELPADEREDISATIEDGEEAEAKEPEQDDGRPRFAEDADEDDETSASEVTAPRTPPDGVSTGSVLAPSKDDLEAERRRLLKGKGVDAAEHRGVQIA